MYAVIIIMAGEPHNYFCGSGSYNFFPSTGCYICSFNGFWLLVKSDKNFFFVWITDLCPRFSSINSEVHAVNAATTPRPSVAGHLHLVHKRDLHLHPLHIRDVHLHLVRSRDLHLHLVRSRDVHLHLVQSSDVNLKLVHSWDGHLNLVHSKDGHLLF